LWSGELQGFIIHKMMPNIGAESAFEGQRGPGVWQGIPPAPPPPVVRGRGRARGARGPAHTHFVVPAGQAPASSV
jgi:hypothetical protein